MAYTFDLEAAIDAIATIEDAITTPTPGIVTAYGYGENPSVIEDPALFPAVVHIPLGPHGPSEISHGTWAFEYDIYSRLLAIEASPSQYPADEAAANLFWKSVTEAFLTGSTRSSLCTSSGALVYQCLFEPVSYAVRNWPPVQGAPNAYWSLQYVHRFTITGG